MRRWARRASSAFPSKTCGLGLGPSSPSNPSHPGLKNATEMQRGKGGAGDHQRAARPKHTASVAIRAFVESRLRVGLRVERDSLLLSLTLPSSTATGRTRASRSRCPSTWNSCGEHTEEAGRSQPPVCFVARIRVRRVNTESASICSPIASWASRLDKRRLD
jgi:hypothetical protein